MSFNIGKWVDKEYDKIVSRSSKAIFRKRSDRSKDMYEEISSFSFNGEKGYYSSYFPNRAIYRA